MGESNSGSYSSHLTTERAWVADILLAVAAPVTVVEPGELVRWLTKSTSVSARKGGGEGTREQEHLISFIVAYTITGTIEAVWK